MNTLDTGAAQLAAVAMFFDELAVHHEHLPAAADAANDEEGRRLTA
jgi:hypothetical protein